MDVVVGLMGDGLLVDFVLVVIWCVLVLLEGVGFGLFVVGCMVGWIVYVFE